MTPGITHIIDEGNAAFHVGLALSANPHSARQTSPLDARLRELAWSHGWLRERGAAELERLEEGLQLMRQAEEVARAAYIKRWSTL